MVLSLAWRERAPAVVAFVWMCSASHMALPSKPAALLLSRGFDIEIATEAAPEWDLEENQDKKRPLEHVYDVLFRDLANHPAVLAWPAPATGITSPYGLRHDPLHAKNTRFHYGLDMEVPFGAPVRAADEGEVLSASWNRGHGLQVSIAHADGWVTSYSHLSEMNVATGDKVRAGQDIGRVGTSGRSTGPHLHLEVLHNGVHLDPVSVLGKSLLYAR